MERDAKKDRISNLPWHILDSILVRVPLKEVVRTSILSSRWIHNWTSLSQFVLDDKCIPNRISDRVARWESIMEVIHRVQLHHTGPIEKFKLAAYCRPDHSDLDQWIHFLTDKGLKEFILQEFDTVKLFTLPVCLFSCPLLNRLELFGCRINPSSPVKGFNSLTNLQLNQVCVSSSLLEYLIANCPVLERLTLLNMDHQSSLRVRNQNLKYLKVHSRFDDICLENSPSLAAVDIGLKVRVLRSLGPQEGRIVRVIGCLHAIQKLTLSSPFLGFLGNISVPDTLPTQLQHLSVLELKDVQLDCITEVKVLFCLLRSAPNLEKLFLSVAETAEPSRPTEIFIQQNASDLYFGNLKVVNVRALRLVATEWILIKSLLARSPMLQELTIVHYGSGSVPAEVLKEAMPASRDVKILNLSH